MHQRDIISQLTWHSNKLRDQGKRDTQSIQKPQHKFLISEQPVRSAPTTKVKVQTHQQQTKYLI